MAAVAQDARGLFAAQCGVCHGDGQGTERGPNLMGNRKIRAMAREDLRLLIRDGVPASGMPAFPKLTATELDSLTALVRGMNATAAEAGGPGVAAAGERYFFGAGGCAGCHMALGRGKAVGPDLSAAGVEMTREEIERAVREPSARIRPGYQTVTVTLRNTPTPIRGFARNHSRYSTQVQDLAGRFHMLAASEMADVKLDAQSMMPAAKCTAEECRDVVAYLASLTGIKPGAPAAAFDSVARAPRIGDWASYHGELSGNRFSALNQITRDNVKDLRLAWVFPVNHNQLEVTPVVVDGVMYITGPNQVWALDARSGRTIWHYQRPRSRDTRGDPAKGTNRGVAIQGDRVFTVTDNARLLALHRVTGALLWETALAADLAGASYAGNYGNTSAPLAISGDLVVAGISGGDLGMRGFLDAYKVATGKRVWRFWTVPAPNEPLAKTSWQGTALEQFGGGGGTWMTGTYDPETDTVFWGVGNPYPSMNGDERRGDNLYTSAVVAVDGRTGKLKWHYQFTPHDQYDWDGGQTPLIVNRTYRGRERKLLIEANRNGFFYVFDRTNGELLLAEKFVDKLTWATGIGKDGRPMLVPGKEPTRDGNLVCPNVLGATNWHSVAFSQETGLFYLMAREDCGVYTKPPSWNPRPWVKEPGHAALRAIDIETGKRVWDVPQIGRADSWGGVLGTAGGVLFFCEDSGALGAVDLRTGKDLWQIQVNSGAELGDGHSWRASPMTYLAAGKQYVAVANGPNILVFALP
ncbi:MAG: PQQ-binding-like beta-propeller repeat protein [Bryobacterales bacterium]|nr:PQQ-binding-like beta-propeller repeat protein [Bryobacterales bacterium]